MRYAGFDPGLATGWATYDSDANAWKWGTWILKKAKPLADLQSKLYRLGICECVGIEKPVGLGYNPMASNSQKVGVIALWAGENGLVRLVAPTTIKKFATGSGKATKEQMMEAATKAWGCKAIDQHQADALWVCCWVVTLGGELSSAVAAQARAKTTR